MFYLEKALLFQVAYLHGDFEQNNQLRNQIKAKTSSPAVAVAAAEPRAEAEPLRAPVSTPVPLPNVLKQLSAGPSAAHKVAQLLPLTLQALCDHTSAELAVILMPDAAGERLALRAYRGLKLSQKLAARDIPLSGNPLLNKLLKVEANIVWQPDKHQHLVSGLALKLMGDKPAMLYSLVIAGKPLGILLACRPPTAQLRDSDFDVFKQLCSATKSAFETARKLKAAAAN